ncbi:SprT family protein [Virgibacillus halophilus]|uniref:Protein SprT-like n=1 Tax=Tigheibacillus halophilus TaxID=361280 RepID=A0ABU5C828_9BACI|nr:SprT family protein [Virgibacillus halophilus]
MEYSSEALASLVNQISLDYFGKPYHYEVMFNARLRTTGGRYVPSLNRIELNPKYATEADKQEFIGIIKHELCHHHLYIEGKGYKHGDADFKNLLKKTGSPRFCTPLPSQQETFKHTYRCKSCGQLYKRRRRMNVAKYRCGKCRGRLVTV